MPARKLADDEISKLLSRMPGWRVANGKLHKQYECKDFNTACLSVGSDQAEVLTSIIVVVLPW